MNDEDLKKLLASTKTEPASLDYKAAFNWNSATDDEKAGIAKDLLALANSRGGGRVIFGVRNSDLEPVGLDAEDFESFDQTKVNDFLHRFSDPRHSCIVYKLSPDGKRHVVIEVPEFPEIPIICKRDYNSSKDHRSLLRRGGIYVRTEKGTSELVSTSEEMRALIQMAVTKKESTIREEILAFLAHRPAESVEPLGKTDEPARASAIPNPVDPNKIR